MSELIKCNGCRKEQFKELKICNLRNNCLLHYNYVFKDTSIDRFIAETIDAPFNIGIFSNNHSCHRLIIKIN